MTYRHWTTVQLQMMREFYPHMPTRALAQVIGRTNRSVKLKAQALGLKKTPAYYREFAGIAGARFAKGHLPANKGVKGWNAGGRSAETRFKPGQRPHTWKPVGSYRTNSDGYLDRKVTDTGYTPRDWVAVHRLVWIEANGPIPAGHSITFKPGRRTTELSLITPDALELVSRVDLMRRNSVHAVMPPELARLVQLRGALIRKINRIERNKPA